MDILPIQASSVPCERIFSSSKETMTARRSRISPHLMEQLQILKFSAKDSNTLKFSEIFDSTQQNKELEEINAVDIETPEDVNTFASSLLGI
jgi:hypothetical protein